jgi:hypothetical protein
MLWGSLYRKFGHYITDYVCYEMPPHAHRYPASYKPSRVVGLIPRLVYIPKSTLGRVPTAAKTAATRTCSTSVFRRHRLLIPLQLPSFLGGAMLWYHGCNVSRSVEHTCVKQFILPANVCSTGTEALETTVRL